MLLEVLHTNISWHLRKDDVWVWVETGEWRPQSDFCRMRSEHLKRSEPPCKLVWLSLRSENDITLDWKGAEKLAITQKQDYQQSATKTIAEDWAEMLRTILRKYYKMSLCKHVLLHSTGKYKYSDSSLLLKYDKLYQIQLWNKRLKVKTNLITTLIYSLNLASQKS